MDFEKPKGARMRVGSLIGVSRQMQRVYKLIHMASPYACPVLIVGESGTGKELAARSIHSMGPRRDKPFVPSALSTLMPSRLEAELFGYATESCDHSHEPRSGLLSIASEGTLFIEEVAELPLQLQSRLSRALEDKFFFPAGFARPVPLRARIIAATQHNLEARVDSGTFLKDLYFGLNAIQIKLPPLRERKDDIPLLVDAFVESSSQPRDLEFSAAAMNYLLAYDWPGNVQELKLTVQRTLANAIGPFIQADDVDLLPGRLSPATSAGVTPLEGEPDIERITIAHALREAAGDTAVAADILGIDPRTLHRRLRHFLIQHWE
jgi:DNA-binding NtrC family response regulator